jgi:nitrous oxide reductase
MPPNKGEKMSKDQQHKKNRRGFLKSSLLLGGAAVASAAAADLIEPSPTSGSVEKKSAPAVDTEHMKNYYRTLKR